MSRKRFVPSAVHRLTLALALLAATCSIEAAQNATVCATDQLDWYTSVVGESPCRTYERLRQICDSRYEVGMFRTNTPGDNCDSQLHSCCCNSIAWNLSMLCMSCQNAGSAEADPSAIDAGNGAYGLYLGSCGVPTNGSLSTNIQTAVCTQKIDIRPTLYDAMWMDSGAWFYTFFRETMQSDFAGETGKNLSSCAVTSSVVSVGNSASIPTPSMSSLFPISTSSTPWITTSEKLNFTAATSSSSGTPSATSGTRASSSLGTSSPSSSNTPNSAVVVGTVYGGVVATFGALLSLVVL